MKYAIALILLASGCLAPAQPTSRTHQAVSANILVNQKLLFDSTVGDNRLGNLCVDGTHLYWSDENGEFGTIWQLSKSGGGARRVAKMMNEVVTIACAAGGIAWIDEELIEKPAPAKSELVKRVKFLAPGGKPKTLASLDEDGKETAEWVGIDAERVYWIIQETKKNGNSPGEVWSASRTGGAPQRIVKNLIDPESAALDRDHIYIVCNGHNTTIPAILAAPKSGGKAVEVARVLDKPADHGTEVSVNSLTASGSSLYWALSAGRHRFGAVIPSDQEIQSVSKSGGKLASRTISNQAVLFDVFRTPNGFIVREGDKVYRLDESGKQIDIFRAGPSGTIESMASDGKRLFWAIDTKTENGWIRNRIYSIELSEK